MTDTAIRTEALVKDHGRVRGLDGLDLEVRSGEVYEFLGPNGAGKTTTIRLLFDLIRPSTGSVTVLGLDPRANGVELRRRVGDGRGPARRRSGRDHPRRTADHCRGCP